MRIVLFILAVIGVALVVSGIMSLKTVFRQQWTKVAEENKAAFGKCMGTAQILCGIGILLFAVLSFLTTVTMNLMFAKIGIFLMIAAAAAAICIYIYIMEKYYK